jgi:RHS repeat-associated protein
MKKQFVYADVVNSPEYMIFDGKRYFFVKDHRGSINLVVNVDSGEVAQRMSYSEFGEVIEDTNPGFRPFGFAGGLYDTDTKLVKFGARDYDGRIGRWLSKDPIRFDGGDANLYGYVVQDPVNSIDPNGKYRWFIPAIGVSVIVVKIVQQCLENMKSPEQKQCEASKASLLKSCGIEGEELLCDAGKKMDC